MKRQITGLHIADGCAADQVPDGIYLARVQQARFYRQGQKPYYLLTMVIVEPHRFADRVIFKPRVLQSESLMEAELVLT